MKFDYVFKLTHGDGRVTEIGYQRLIALLEIGDEIVYGRKLSAGGVPQAETVKRLVGKVYPDISIGVFFNGNEIL